LIEINLRLFQTVIYHVILYTALHKHNIVINVLLFYVIFFYIYGLNVFNLIIHNYLRHTVSKKRTANPL